MQARRRREPSGARYAVAALGGLACHIWLALPSYTQLDRFGGWSLLLMALVALYDVRRSGETSVPVILLVTTQVYLFYGVPQFSQETLSLIGGEYSPPSDALSAAVWLVVAGEGAFLFAYGATRRRLNGRNPLDLILPQPGPGWRTPVIVYAIPSFMLHLLNAFRPEYIPVVVRMAVLQWLNAYLALGMLLYFGHKMNDRHCLFLAWVLVALMGAVGFIQGMMGAVVFPVLLTVMADWVWAQRVKLSLMALLVVVVLIVNPAKNEFRRLAFNDRDVSSVEKVINRLNDWSTGFDTAWGEVRGETAAENIGETASRSSDLLSFAQAIDFVPSRIPYNHGHGLGTSFIYWIPRFLWPTKPGSSDLLYNRYAVDFGYTTEEGTRRSTTGASVFTEGYWNFGALGVLAFLAALGVILALLLSYNGRSGDASTLAAMAYLGGSWVLLQPVALAAPAAVTFVLGIFVAMWTIKRVAGATRQEAFLPAEMGRGQDPGFPLGLEERKWRR